LLHVLLPLAPAPRRARPPPGSASFPYTTLFRSQVIGLAVPGVFEGGLVSAHVAVGVHAGQTRQDAGAGEPGAVVGVMQQHRPTGDRKSTRLNSSHVSISYAVFCLKIKKPASQAT